jgi:FkbM family methyltransferase
MTYPVIPTSFTENPYSWDWYSTDFFHSPDGSQEFPNHHCKKTWISSLPFINGKRNAIDVGCRDGEYTRYLHKDFNHVFCFDYRRRKLFHKNVDLSKITHFKCALGEEHKVVKVSGGGSITSGKIPLEKWYDEQLYTIDEFDFPDIDYIKIDVDGYELNVLQGAINTINKYNPLLIVEQENSDTRAIDFCKSNLNYDILSWDADHRNVILGKIK